jgi:lipopolysaccharide/colanic/teichoic acid biosynthesis glycosyltransferase
MIIKAWLYSIASIFSLAVLFAARHFRGADVQFMGESLGLIIVLLSCQICFHLNGADELLVESKTQIFLQRALSAAGAGLLIAAVLFYIFPRVSPGFTSAAASACFLIFGLVVLRPVFRSAIRRQEPDEMEIENEADSFERINRKVWLEGFSADLATVSKGGFLSKTYLGLRRIFDVLLSCALLVIAAPLMVLIALVVKFDSAGPAVFSQERVGLQGKLFMVHKFRSMRQDAERRTGPMWAREDDDRITRVGAFLRKRRLDELPQLWDVLRGHMSFIGPRPERPYFVELLKRKIPHFDVRHNVKPGVTGWAQVMYPYGASVEDAYHKLEYDLYYVKHLSLKLDVLILLKTIAVVARGEGR